VYLVSYLHGDIRAAQTPKEKKKGGRKTKRKYESRFALVLVVAAFLMDMSQAQLLPPNSSQLAEKYAYCDTVLTVLFDKELLINLSARSADYTKQVISTFSSN
jgi:hypothetical protein